jgi:diketogulonate reductase-like aldo/keto reductase
MKQQHARVLAATVAAAAAVAVGAAAPTIAPVPTISLSHTNSSRPPVTIPRVLLGTGGGGGGFDASLWLNNGGMGFDTAQTYCYTSVNPFCSHVAIANAMASSSAAQPFLISKIEPEDFGPVDFMSGFGRAVTRGILQDLSVSRVDMLMAHQAGRHETDTNVRPPCFNISGATDGTGTYNGCRIQMMQSFLSLVASGVASSIGVSNWQIRDLVAVYNATGAWPSALEVEVHPYWHEDALLDFCIAQNITIINYAPLAVSPTHGLLTDPAVVAVAQAHGVTPAQAALRWGLQRTQGVVIPRSANLTHMAENVDVFGFELTAAEMASLGALPQKKIFSVYCQDWC